MEWKIISSEYCSAAEKELLEKSGAPYILEPGFWEKYKMRVMFVSVEFSSIDVRAGGLADVAGNLSAALAKKGVKVDVVVPYHQMVKRIHFDSPGSGEDDSRDMELYLDKNPAWQRTLFAQHGQRPLVWRSALAENLNYTLLGTNREDYFGKDQRLYVGANPASGPGDAERFLSFSLQAAAYLNMVEQNGYPMHLLHLNDWSSGTTAFFQKMLNGQINTPTVFSVHNIYSGRLDMGFFNELSGNIGANPDHWFVFDALHRAGFQMDGQIDMLAAGLKWSDNILTVSPQYRKELLNSAEFAKGYLPIFRMLDTEEIFGGIVNGYNPDFEINAVLKKDMSQGVAEINNTKDLLRARKFMKEEMQKEARLTVDPSAMLVGFVNRWDDQKSYKETIEVMRRLMSSDKGNTVQFIATGLTKHEPEKNALFLDLQRQFPGRVAILDYSDKLARRLMPALDLHLMPSKYEPCGISQLNGYASGTPTLANDVGGLHDTIEDNYDVETQTGYLFNSFSSSGRLSAEDFKEEFYQSMIRAVTDYQQHPEQWKLLVENAYAKRAEYSWDSVAEKYLNVYGNAYMKRMKEGYIFQRGNPREHVFRSAWLLERRRR